MASTSDEWEKQRVVVDDRGTILPSVGEVAIIILLLALSVILIIYTGAHSAPQCTYTVIDDGRRLWLEQCPSQMPHYYEHLDPDMLPVGSVLE